MDIQAINPNSWNDILQLQREAYVDIEPESLSTLQSKWRNSPQLCFVCSVENRVAAYLLAHAWAGQEYPKLYEDIADAAVGAHVFLHDLAVSKQFSGRGIGASMARHLIGIADQQGFAQIGLIAVQNSQGFWTKMGFETDTQQCVCPSYGINATAMRRKIHT
jgi:ribosomal protein S18 acetylase RimI-like enzyme